jgi:hypothetical protein
LWSSEREHNRARMQAMAGQPYIVGRDGVTVVLRQSDKIEVLATNHSFRRSDRCLSNNCWQADVLAL